LALRKSLGLEDIYQGLWTARCLHDRLLRSCLSPRSYSFVTKKESLCWISEQLPKGTYVTIFANRKTEIKVFVILYV